MSWTSGTSSLRRRGASDANTHLDGDGQSNLEEFLAGRNPQNPTRVLQIVSIDRSPAQATAGFTSVSGKQYVLDASTNLSSWAPISGTLTGTGNTVTVDDPDAGDFTKRFYRAALVP